MHFTTLLATSAAVTGALASGAAYYEESSYYTSAGKVYTSAKTCSEEAAPTKPAVYGHATTPVYVAPTSAPVYVKPTSAPVYVAPYSAPNEVTYTSYAKITITSCAPYVTNCPAAVYTSTAYSVSTCNEAGPSYYVPPSNNTAVYEYTAPPVYSAPAATTTECSETPAVYPTETPAVYPTETPTYTATYYTTVCPGAEYCYATTVTSTWCPGATTAYTTVTPVPVATYTPAPPAVYTSVTPVYNTSTYSPPPSYTGAASANTVSFGVAAIAGLLALFIAA